MKKFEGFPEEKQVWSFPNVINGWVHILTGAEFKCLWYILRHTYGWQKTKDKISTSQFMKGIFIKEKDEWLDKGTGLSNRKVIDALRQLEKYGFVNGYKKTGKTTEWEVVKKVHKTYEESSQVAYEESSQTINNLTINNKTINKERGNGRFTPPSLEEISDYCLERKNLVNSDTFFNFYESKGWVIGKSKMKNWRAAVRTWEKRESKSRRVEI